MSLFVRLQTSFWTHRKTLRLKVRIGEAALWLPPRLWSYAAENQPDGDFTQYSADEIALLLGCSTDAQAMLQALQDSGFMDGMKIHDWDEHNEHNESFSDGAKKAALVRWENERKRKEKEKTGKDKTREEKRQALLADATSIPSGIAIPECFANVEGFISGLGAWIDNRKQLRKPATDRAIQLMVKKLAEQPIRAIGALETCICNGWQGFEWAWLDRRQNGKPVNGSAHVTTGEWTLSEPQIRLAALFKRPSDMRWSTDEVSAYEAIPEIVEADIIKLERQYASNQPETVKYRFKDLLKLLSNYNTAVDRARNWREQKCF